MWKAVFLEFRHEAHGKRRVEMMLDQSTPAGAAWVSIFEMRGALPIGIHLPSRDEAAIRFNGDMCATGCRGAYTTQHPAGEVFAVCGRCPEGKCSGDCCVLFIALRPCRRYGSRIGFLAGGLKSIKDLTASKVLWEMGDIGVVEESKEESDE